MSLNIYKASAGSGKTFQLALEYIAFALQSQSPNAFANILAVTFTNKATCEMKSRILIQLYNLANGGQDPVFMKLICQKTGLNNKEVQKRATNTLKAIIHDYDHFRVETIDSFFQSLLTNLAHELKLTRGFNVDLDTDEVISQAIDRLLLAINDKGKKTTGISSTLLNYMEEQIEDDKGWNISKQLKSFAKSNLFTEKFLQNEKLLTERFNDISSFNTFKSQLRHLIEKNQQEIVKPLEELKILLSDPNAKDLKCVGTYFASFKKGLPYTDPAQTLIKGMKDPKSLLTVKNQKSADHVELAQKASLLINDIENKRNKIADTISTCELILKNLIPLYLLSEIGNEVNHINEENGTFMLAKTPDFLQKMVDGNDASFIFEKAGNSFNHVLIDEFQDTSAMQWDNFKNLLINNIAQGNDCMLVGDIKQSIYRWRGGDWEILKNIKQNMKALCQVNEKTLDNNFRSLQQVVEFNNSFFKKAIAKIEGKNQEDLHDENNTITDIYKDVKQTPKDQSGTGYVRVCLPSKKSTADEVIEDVYNEIKKLNNDFKVPLDKIGILVRRNSEAVKLINYFAEHHPDIPLTSDEAFQLSASPAVLLLVNALKYMNNPEDTVALATCNKMAENLGCYTFKQIESRIEFSQEQRNKWLNTPLFELCQILITIFNLPQSEKNGCGQSAYLFSFMDHVQDFLQNHSSNLTNFITYWDEVLYKKAIAVDIHDAVYIMTIHKSKGLERHTIIIPFCNWSLDSDRPEDILWCNQIEEAPYKYLPLSPINTYASKKVKASKFKNDYYNEHLMKRIDSMNELYVAFTRAKVNLLIWSQQKPSSIYEFIAECTDTDNHPSEEKKASDTNDWVITEYGSLKEYHDKQTTNVYNPLDENFAKPQQVILSKRNRKIKFRQSNQAKDFIRDLQNEEGKVDDASADTNSMQSYIDRGKLLHFLFSQIKSKNDVKQAIDNILQQGLIADQKEAESLQRFIDRRITSPQVAKWFDGSWKLFNECSLLQHNENKVVETIRPDRIMTKADQTVVVDYKFGKSTGPLCTQYQEQVRKYMHALHQMNMPNIKGYLWFVFSGEIIEVKA